MTNRKGIILAGGSGTRLYPITIGVSKQLLPVYDKPMIYYPLSVLMLGGIREVAIITTPQDQEQFQRTLGDGSQWGMDFTYIVQPSPDGLAQAYLLTKAFLAGAPSALVLGDNIFYGHDLPGMLKRADGVTEGGTVFGYRVADPERYGVVAFGENGKASAIIEKPEVPSSNFAVTGLYFLDGTAPDRAKEVKPSERGELEITTLLEMYLHEGALSVERMGRGYAWLDTGTHGSLLDAGNFVRTLKKRQGLQTGSPDEISYANGWIDRAELLKRAEKFQKNGYGQYLGNLSWDGRYASWGDLMACDQVGTFGGKDRQNGVASEVDMISIIIPCFNAAAVLREAYDTLPKQGEQPGGHDLEIILADDGSSDGTRELVTQIAAEDPRVKPVFNAQNMGVSETRNAALAAAGGSLIFFMDADDKLTEGALDCLLQHMTPDVDFVRGKHLLWDAQTGALRENVGEERNFPEVHGIPPKAFPQIMAVYSSWNALMRKSVIDNLDLKFPVDLHIGEDRLFNFKYLMTCRKITFLNDYTYLWRRNASEGTQATQLLVKKPDHMFGSIRSAVALLANEWFAQHPAHRSALATQMLMEMCNNIAAFSRQIQRGDLPDGVKEDIDWSIANLHPDWINIQVRSLKGRIDVYLPLYDQAANSVGTPPDAEVYRNLFRTLGQIRRVMSEQAAQDTAKNAAAPSSHPPQEANPNGDLIAQVFAEARALQSPEVQEIEARLLEKSGLFDAQYYVSTYPDVAQPGLKPAQHYLQFGAGEQRSPNSWFDGKAYFMRNPSLVLFGANPLVHYFKTTIQP